MENINLITKIIEDAKSNYPQPVRYNIRLSDDEMAMLEKECEILYSSTFENGNNALSLKYKGQTS